MKRFDVQAVPIAAPFDRAYAYIADAATLPEWTSAFVSVSADRAVLRTPGGETEIGLSVETSRCHGTIDWIMSFPDGRVARAASRLLPLGDEACVYAFTLLPPPVPLEMLEGAIEQQAATLREELKRLQARLAARAGGGEAA